ncbi:hypothetical protein SASPL_101754 [Salvia splendens]|uniref:Transcription repressor n=1 Tax=Salvia splendens TaxID=180675 RepID=A0A8X8YVF3_SALSN|nr:hypothetical protein SASPL_101754 [Salvia splendens]
MTAAAVAMAVTIHLLPPPISLITISFSSKHLCISSSAKSSDSNFSTILSKIWIRSSLASYSTISDAFFLQFSVRFLQNVTATATPTVTRRLNRANFAEERREVPYWAEAKTIDDGETYESESVAGVVMDSMNPFVDFKASMAEMVEAYGCRVRDWEFLEELLGWYLSVNDDSNHGYIVGAFVDLLIDEDTSSSSLSSSSSLAAAAANYSFTSPLSFTSYSTEEDINIIVHK